ncbi:MAG: YihY/virulence factor BrkB family protein [Fibrobacterota bacterium]|nr:YihY/virulence factor BrkB family protein [Fibrobacterota bacterium]
MVMFARRILDSAEGGLVAGIGTIFLLYAVLRLLNQIERAFNHIWSVSKPRTWGRKFSDYLSLILVGPFLIIGASSLNVALAAFVNRAAEAVPLSDLIDPVANLALRAVPFLMLWVLFSFLFSFLPNTKVRLGSAAIGGAFTAVVYQLLQILYIGLQVGVTKANAIYGSFAALPLFLIWLQLSWLFVLMGAEVTHHHQNYENEAPSSAPNRPLYDFGKVWDLDEGFSFSTQRKGQGEAFRVGFRYPLLGIFNFRLDLRRRVACGNPGEFAGFIVLGSFLSEVYLPRRSGAHLHPKLLRRRKGG